MSVVSRLTSLAFIAAITGGVGYAAGSFFAPDRDTEETTVTGTTVSAGQFTIPVFDGASVAYVLLAQMHVEVTSAEQVAILSRSRPRLRAVILESLFALERRGGMSPDTLDPEVVAAAIEADLEQSFEVGDISGVLIERLLLQENMRGRRVPSLDRG